MVHVHFTAVRGNPYQRTFLAVRDKSTNQVRMFETQSAVVAARVSPPDTANAMLKERVRK